ncbi:lipase 3-like [Anticarsia gemmatalis]|uniref:lipase 3-like n=1 Tax=Anticarsia gemmatalis TaxID=129554 RepID=UPI003F76F166
MKPRKQAVLLFHGLLGSADDWLLLGPRKALPYRLSDLGYDVWLLNARGNMYCRLNLLEDKDFWNFSFHQMGYFDLAAVITYIKEFTQYELSFVGHSMGATALLVLLSSLPEYNDMLRTAVLMAPLAFMRNVKGPLRHLSKLRINEQKISIMQSEEFMLTHFPQYIIDKFCNAHASKYCLNANVFITNSGRDPMDTSLMETVVKYVPAGGSVKTLLHLLQLVRTGHFHRYDNGIAGNLQIYDQENPPEYELKAISLPLSLISSSSDKIANAKDVITLISKLNNARGHYIIRQKGFSHMDFLWSAYAAKHVYKNVLDALELKF